MNKLINGINSKTKLVFSSIVLLNFLDVKQNSKTLKSDIYPNSYKILNFLVQDNRISLKAQEAKPDIEFPLSIIINYKCNQFLENFESSLILEIPENTLKYYLGNGYATPTNSLKFNTLSSGAKQTVIFSFKENFNSSTNQIGSKIALNIKKYTQIILVQLLNADNSISDSYSIKISDLLYYFNDQNSFQQTLLFHNKPFVVLFKLERGGLNEKKTQSEASRSQEISKLEDKKSKADKDQNGSENKNKKKGEGSDLDQLKSKIQNLKKENANLTTQLCREQKITILKHKTIEELEVIINRKEVNNSLNAEKKKSKPLDQAKINKTKELFNSICVCGAGYPKFKGYCIECLKKLKSEYEKALNEYLPLNDKLENISQKNMNHISK